MATDKKVTNISVTSLNFEKTRAAAMWDLGRARFHVWFELDTREIEGSVLYKNEPETPNFKVRRLDALATSNAWHIRQAFEEIDRGNLIAQAIEEHDRLEREEADAFAESTRIEKIKPFAAALLDMLERITVSHDRLERERGSVVATYTADSKALIAKVSA